MGKDNLQICLLIFLSPVLLLSFSRADSTYLYHTCGIDGNYTAFSPFQNNLNRLLLRRLHIEGGISGFYNTSVGDPPDEAFGLFLCRGDVGPADCQSCIDEASSRILETCPGRKNAIIWYDECLIRYTNRNFFSIMEYKPGLLMWNSQNSTDQKKLRETLLKTLPKLIEEVVSDPSKMMYGTTNISLSSSEVLFELVQCFPNLSKSDCSRCLSLRLIKCPSSVLGQGRSCRAATYDMRCTHFIARLEVKSQFLHLIMTNPPTTGPIQPILEPPHQIQVALQIVSVW